MLYSFLLLVVCVVSVACCRSRLVVPNTTCDCGSRTGFSPVVPLSCMGLYVCVCPMTLIYTYELHNFEVVWNMTYKELYVVHADYYISPILTGVYLYKSALITYIIKYFFYYNFLKYYTLHTFCYRKEKN